MALCDAALFQVALAQRVAVAPVPQAELVASSFDVTVVPSLQVNEAATVDNNQLLFADPCCDLCAAGAPIPKSAGVHNGNRRISPLTVNAVAFGAITYPLG